MRRRRLRRLDLLLRKPDRTPALDAEIQRMVGELERTYGSDEAAKRIARIIGEIQASR